MNQAERLVPRLLASLNTLDNDTEIASTVRLLRRALGPPGFARLETDTRTVGMDHIEPGVSTRIRSLGFLLRRATPPVTELAGAIERTREAMITGDEVTVEDLLLTLACIRDILTAAQEQMAAARLEDRIGEHMNHHLTAMLGARRAE